MSENFYMNKRNWANIKRQYIFEAVVMYQPKRPLGFFVEDSANPNRGSVVTGLGAFNAGQEYKAVVGLKQRKVVILSPDDQNNDIYKDDVLVAPVYSLDEEDKQEEWYKQYLEKDQHPLWVLLPEDLTGSPCYVDLTEVFPVKKNMLLSRKKLVPDDRMDRIEQVMKICAGFGLRVEASRERGNI